MAEFLLDSDPDRMEAVKPDSEGFTVRTRFKNTQQILDQNAALRSELPKTFHGDKAFASPVARVPLEVWEIWMRECGGHPDLEFLKRKLNSREWSYLKTREVKL